MTEEEIERLLRKMQNTVHERRLLVRHSSGADLIRKRNEKNGEERLTVQVFFLVWLCGCSQVFNTVHFSLFTT